MKVWSTGSAAGGALSGDRLSAEYVLPLKWSDAAEFDDLTAYLEDLADWLDVTVVDGSERPVFERHHHRWAGIVRHVAPRPWPGRNGKVAGVVTGVTMARHERLIIADDDVRWRRAQLVRAVRLLDGADLVRPQNVFDPLPWHARWDTGRTLINRAIAADYPGTYGLRRGIFLRMGGYDGDAMFENLEMARTIRAAGGVERRVDDLFVRRRPPTAAHFWRQRTRQAYDDLAQPGRLLAELAVLPMTIALLWSGHRYLGRAGVVGAALVPVIAALLVAEAGRRRDGGREAFAETAAWWAPVWVAERAVLIWFAVGCRLRGGVRYGDQRLLLAAHRVRTLRRRVRSAPPLRCQSGERADAGPTGGHRTR